MLKNVSRGVLRKPRVDPLRRSFGSTPASWGRRYDILTVGGAPLSVLKPRIMGR